MAKKSAKAGTKKAKVAKRATPKKRAAPVTKKPPAKTAKRATKKPMNMVSNEPLVGKGTRDEAVPAIEKKVATKSVAAGKKNVIVPVRTGIAGGRAGGGGTGELSPARDTAAGRGHGKKRKKR